MLCVRIYLFGQRQRKAKPSLAQNKKGERGRSVVSRFKKWVKSIGKSKGAVDDKWSDGLGRWDEKYVIQSDG